MFVIFFVFHVGIFLTTEFDANIKDFNDYDK